MRGARTRISQQTLVPLSRRLSAEEVRAFDEELSQLLTGTYLLDPSSEDLIIRSSCSLSEDDLGMALLKSNVLHLTQGQMGKRVALR